MLGKQKQRLEDLKHKRDSFRWDIEEIKHSDMDPDRKAMYLNDVEYNYYMLDLEIESIEHELGMLPLKLMLVGFVIFVIAMFLYMMH
jgi:hypothetical protein